MILFSILLFPLASLWLIAGKRSEKRPVLILLDFRDYYLTGVLFFIPAAFLVKIFTGFLSKTYTLPNIYLYHFFTDYFFYQLTAMAASQIRFRDLMYAGPDEKTEHYFLFFAGFFTSLVFNYSFARHGNGNFYDVFILPVSWLMMAGLTTLFMIFREMESGYVRIYYTAALFLLPAAAAFIPFFFYIKIYSLFFIVFAGLPAVGYYLIRENAVNI